MTLRGAVTGIEDGALIGWIAVAPGAEVPELEALADGEAPFARATPRPSSDGRLSFAIPIPNLLRDRKIRFLDVRPAGADAPLPGGPVAFDGDLLKTSGAWEAAMRTADPARAWTGGSAPSASVRAEGAVLIQGPDIVAGWAFDPDAPETPVRVEILAGEAPIAQVTADGPAPDAAAGAPAAARGFSIDLSRVLRRGPHALTVRAEGAAEPLAAGRFSVGPFAMDGEVAPDGYLSAAEDRALLGALALESAVLDGARMPPERLTGRLVNRLRRERAAFEAAAPGPAVLLDLDGDDDLAALWSLQSHPAAAYVRPAGDAAAILEAAAGADYVFLGRAGDRLHPSAAGVVARLGGPDVVAWARFCADQARAGAPGVVLRRPAFDPVTARSGAVTDTTLAIKGAVLAEAPDAVLQALAEGRLHPLYFWLAGRGLDWRIHPEALTTSLGEPPAPTHDEFAADEALYRQLLAEEDGEFSLQAAAADMPFPYVLVPTRRASKVSVLVPFRDRADLTLRCVASLARQRLSGELELVLIDNRSTPDQARKVEAGARGLLGDARVQFVAYDAPFNHADQNNLAAQAATGDVVVICNNDIALVDPAALEQLAAWALRPGIGTVGCRLENPERAAGSYGHVIPSVIDHQFRPLLVENPDPTYGRFVHAVPGNTLALAAMARARFLDLGGLDSVRFPIGYDDTEFMLRCAERGLIHLYLGHVEAEHRRGSSRTGDDESLQALWIAERYWSHGFDRFRQLVREPVGRGESSDGALRARAELRSLREALEAALDAGRAAEAARGDLADLAPEG